MVKYGHDLKEKLCDRGPQWGLHDLCTACFKKNTGIGDMSAEDHARAVRTTLAACSGQCDPITILRAIQYATFQSVLHSSSKQWILILYIICRGSPAKLRHALCSLSTMLSHTL